jgi:hypothetical protein
MGEIKAIETVYNGYRFRSRLEARWAVFFDALGVEYEYEPEGFKHENGECYLPDFYLCESKTYVEVKANREGAFDELLKATSFVQENGIHRLLILSNIPQDKAPNIWHYPYIYYHSGRNESMMARAFFMKWKDYGYLQTDFGVDYLGEKHMRGMRLPKILEINKFLTPIHDFDMPYDDDFPYAKTFYPEDSLGIDKAYEIARQAQFEHGKTPTGRRY